MDIPALFSGLSLLGVIGTGVGVVHTMNKDRSASRKEREKELEAHTEAWTNMSRDIGDVKLSIANVEHTLGNGGYKGIKQDIQNIQLNCASEMADLKRQIETNTPRITDLEHRLNEAEKKN